MSIFAFLRPLFQRNRQTPPVPQSQIPMITRRGLYHIPGFVVLVEHGVFAEADLAESGILDEPGWTIYREDGFAYCSKVAYLDGESALERLTCPAFAGKAVRP